MMLKAMSLVVKLPFACRKHVVISDIRKDIEQKRLNISTRFSLGALCFILFFDVSICIKHHTI